MPTSRIPVRVTTVDALRKRLTAAVARYERRYGISSAEMQRRLDTNKARCTPENAKWMQAYYVLQTLDKQEVPDAD